MDQSDLIFSKCSDSTECGYPEQSPQSRVHLDGSVARYSCSAGHRISGQNTQRTYQSDGLWSGDTPHCEGEALVSPVSPTIVVS